MDRIFQRLLENQFSELAGLTVNASIPIPERLVNEVVQLQLRGNKNITSCQVGIHRENRISVDLRTPMWPWPLNLKLKLFGSVDLTPSPRLRAFLENNLLLGKLGSLFKGLPGWITLYNDQVSVDLGSFLSPEQKRFLALIESLELHTEEGKIIFDVKVRA